MTDAPAPRTRSTTTPRIGVVARPQLSPPQLVDAVRRADDAGLDDAWLWEDCFLEGGISSATAVLAASRSIRVGVGLMPVPLRNPALAAMEIATLAELFPGRFAPAVGHGVLEWMGQVGARVGSPMTLLREWTTAVVALLSGERVTVDGRYVRLDGVALDRPPSVVPPLMVGGRGPRTLALAGELAAGTIVDSANSPADVRTVVDQIAPGPGHALVVDLRAAADTAGAALHLDGSSWAAPDGIAAGDPSTVAKVVQAYADAGATTVALYTAGANPDMAGFVNFVAAVRDRVRRGDSADPVGW